MSRQRSPILIQLRKDAAERRVRAGDAYADVARDLGVSLTTLGNWAAVGRWRKKDIALEQGPERSQALLARLAETRIREQEKASMLAARTRELSEAFMKAMQAADTQGNNTPPWS